jgi:unsaturated rhamnogalacturonyl hydrolase
MTRKQKTVVSTSCVFLFAYILCTAECLSDERRQNIFHDNKDKTALEIAQLVGNKYITSDPRIYSPADPLGLKDEVFRSWFYPTGVTLWSLCQLSDISQDPSYLDFVCRSFDYYLDNNKVVYRKNMNRGGVMGHALLEANNRRPNPRYKELVRKISHYYEHEQTRLLDGSICYKNNPELRQTWIDSLFVWCPIQVKSAKLFDQPQRYEDVMRQFFNFTTRLQDPQIKLFYQGWGWGINRTTHSPGFWCRGNGWVIVAMTESLKAIPPDQPGREKLLGLYQDFAKAILKEQSPSGRWHQLLTRHDSYQETSGTAMFIYSFIEGYKNDWLGKEYKNAAIKGFEGLKQKIDQDGNIYDTCMGCGTQNTLKDYYEREKRTNEQHAIGPVILAACAVSSLDK